MNWAQAKALNSTVGTPNFKSLDIVIKEMLDSVKGSMRKIDNFSPITIQPSNNWASPNESDLTILTHSSNVAGNFFVIEYKVTEANGRAAIFRTEPMQLASATLDYIDTKMMLFGSLVLIYLRIYKPVDTVGNNVRVSTYSVSAEYENYGEEVEADYTIDILNIYKMY